MAFTLLNSVNETVESEKDVMSRIKSAKKRATDRENTVGFALEDDEGKIVKVFVRSEQAEDFERALSRAQYQEDGEDKEIAEILFDLRKDFDIIDVDWEKGSIPEDEEIDNELGDEGDSEGDDLDLNLDGDEGEDVLGLGGDEEDLDGALDSAEMGGDDTQSALQSVIDMLKANAEAEKAKAEAEKAKAEAEVAKAANSAAKLRAEQEEEILDMEEYNKRKKEEEEIEKTRQELIKYRHERKNSHQRTELGESMKNCKYDGPTPEEEELLDMEKWEEEEREKKKLEKERERLIRFRHSKKQAKKEEEEKMRKRLHKYMESAELDSVKEISFLQFLELDK